jgi:hypothetical protein
LPLIAERKVHKNNILFGIYLPVAETKFVAQAYADSEKGAGVASKSAGSTILISVVRVPVPVDRTGQTKRYRYRYNTVLSINRRSIDTLIICYPILQGFTVVHCI